MDGLVAQIRESEIFKGHEVVLLPGDDVKMSEVLLDFLEPYLHLAESLEAFKKLTMLGVVAWNAALLKDSGQADGLDHILASTPPPDRKDVKSLVTELVRRKRKRFSAYKRLIADFRVEDTKKGYHLSVAAILPADED